MLRKSKAVDQKDSRDTQEDIGNDAQSNNGNDMQSDTRNDTRRTSANQTYSHTMLVHKQYRVSPLDKESGAVDFRGFYNLALLALAVTVLRLVIENYHKYGILVKLPDIDVTSNEWKWATLCLLLMPIHLVAAVKIELEANQLVQKGMADHPKIRIWHILNIALTAGIPTLIVWFLIDSPVAGSAGLFFPTILSLKLVSYALVNHDLRQEAVDCLDKNNGETTPSTAATPTDAHHPDEIPFDPNAVLYPDNLTLNNIFYFWLAPTLCYQTSYPRTKRFRKTYFAKRVIECCMSLMVMYFLVEQYAMPTLRNSIKPMKELSPGRLLERLLKLSITSLLIWILMFYAFFYAFLTAFAEVLRFSDRRFYLAWWNSRDLAEYWRLWNLPVSTWAKRHAYLPLVLRRGLPNFQAQFVVFFVSAVLHELVIGVPTHSLYGLAFFAMMAQIPLIWFTAQIRNLRSKWGWIREDTLDTIGNLVFWFSFCLVGQPLAVMLYWYDFQRKQGAFSEPN
jgi:diacylglycerol O-acyltransferase-1